MDFFAFMAAPMKLLRPGVDAEQFAGHFTKPKNEPEVDNAKPPVFKRRWWFSRRRLDIRPLAWSLRNRPQEWAWHTWQKNTIVHMPTDHRYYIGRLMPYHQSSAPVCNCQHASRGRFQRGQQKLFGDAFAHWQTTPYAHQRSDA